MIILLALRNLLRNKKNSILLSILIAFITIIFFLGSSILRQSSIGLRKTYVNNLTADLIVQKKNEVSMNLFGANTPVIDDYFTIPVLPASTDIQSILSTTNDFEATPIISSKAVLDVYNKRSAALLLGIEAETYFSIFPGIIIERGRFLEAGEHGIMITDERANKIERRSKKKLTIGMPVKLTIASGSSFKIREIPLIGVYSYKNPGPYMNEVNLVDPQTARALNSVMSVATENVEVLSEATELLTGDLDDLFGDIGSIDEVNSFNNDMSFDNLQSALFKEDNRVANIGGDWNFILIRANSNTNIYEIQKRLNVILEPYGVIVEGWRVAAGNTAITVFLIQSLFYGGIFLVCIAGVISIVNIVLISVFRRTKEIGTLRAIGASDGYISYLILLENFFLSFFAGIIGILISFLLLIFINGLGLSLSNELLSALLGQSVINLSFIPIEALKSIIVAVVLGLISSIYPCWQAIVINPIEAVRRG